MNGIQAVSPSLGAAAELGIASTTALVVDDSPQAVVWAEQTGARTVLVHADPSAAPDAIPRIATLADLPTFLTFPQYRG